MTVYSSEHIPHTHAAKNSAYNIDSIIDWWGGKKLSSVTAANCRAYAGTKTPAAARRDLEVLRAAINYWHKNRGPLPVIPAVTLPAKSQPRDSWLTRDQARAFRREAMRTPHLYRFLMLGLMTGSRSGVIFSLQWSWFDLVRGTMLRRAPGEAETANKRTPPVRLAKRFVRLLRRWRAKDAGVSDYVVHIDGKPISSVKRSWAGARAAAGLPESITPHTLRHTRATWLMQEDVDVWEAAGHLGMTPETLTRVYGKHSPEYQKRAAEI